MKSGFVYLIIIVAIIAIIFTLFQPSYGSKDIDISTVISMAKSGQLREIEVDGDKLTVTTLDDKTFRSRKESGSSIVDILNQAGVPAGTPPIIKVKEKSQLGSLFSIFLNFLPLIFFGAVLLFLLRQAQGGSNQALGFGRSRARMVMGNKPTITFMDVAGVDEAKVDLQEVVEFLRYPEKFAALGARVPRGVLLVGSPGTGKTLLSRAVAGEAGVPFFSISGSEFVEMFVGVGASRVRDLFDQAKRNAPCIVFVDEIDAVGRHRGAGLGGGHDEREQTLNQILVEMDGFDSHLNVIVLAATNRPDILDPALLRPGRFDRRIVLDLPDINGRKAILEVHSKGKPLDASVNLEVLAKQTPGFSGADLANLVNEAAILAARHSLKTITMREVEEAIDRVVAGPERKSRLINAKEKAITAYHEMGHALVARMLEHSDPVHKVSIVARGTMGGYTRLLPTEDRYMYSRSQFKAMLATSLGGRVAEDLTFDEITTGASNDLENATRMARKMITEYGMSDSLGPRTFGHKEELVFLGKELGETRNYSEKIAEEIDHEVTKLIKEAEETARELLTKNQAKLAQMAERLIEVETMDGKELQAAFDSDPSADLSKIVPQPKETPPPVAEAPKPPDSAEDQASESPPIERPTPETGSP
ncbi:MAG: ATP-dependent zinc metalloprotease FtsH [Dehalococcoidia bacterium]